MLLTRAGQRSRHGTLSRFISLAHGRPRSIRKSPYTFAFLRAAPTWITGELLKTSCGRNLMRDLAIGSVQTPLRLTQRIEQKYELKSSSTYDAALATRRTDHRTIYPTCRLHERHCCYWPNNDSSRSCRFIIRKFQSGNVPLYVIQCTACPTNNRRITQQKVVLRILVELFAVRVAGFSGIFPRQLCCICRHL